MSYHLYRRILSWCKADRNRSIIAAVSVLLAIGGTTAAALDYAVSRTEITGGLTRNTYEKGARTEELMAEAEGQEGADTIEASVSPRAYTEKEIREVFDKSIKKMEEWILGENKSPDRVESDLNLITEIPGEPVDVSWETDRYDVISVRGELNREQIDAQTKADGDGILVMLGAVLTYRDRVSDQARYECLVRVYPETLRGKDGFIKRLKKKIEENDVGTRTEPVLMLPDSVDGQKVRFYPVMDKRGIVLLAMAILMPVLLLALGRQNREKEAEDRRRQLRIYYPELVNKLTLLLGAGMTVKRAWIKITEDAYKRGDKQMHYIYEEMRYTCREMESGVMESESYEHFGRRCGIQEYIRLGALLSQNLRKGTKGLNALLRAEAVQAFEERKARAKRLGEEAGTKLLLPMFLMLAVVLVIVVVPAFLSIQL